ncbi:helix-turn-helix domain-containing protein [Aliikangiella maris]|uniref:Helix-turn-helix transcriptional regulator n=2 Tax=Aliikangiella maris TaxID=3162458 RepID=A0ABV3MUP9_9GAMM
MEQKSGNYLLVNLDEVIDQIKDPSPDNTNKQSIYLLNIKPLALDKRLLPDLLQQLQNISATEADGQSNIDNLLLNIKSSELIHQLINDVNRENEASFSAEARGDLLSDQYANFMAAVDNVLKDMYASTELKVKDLAKKLAISERQFNRKLKVIMDMTPTEYIRFYRLKKSKSLLLEGQRINTVAFAVGFSSLSYFCRCFKIEFGLSPSEFIYQAKRMG